jgi:TolB-like protein
LEWKLAAQRTHMMSERTAFLLPVVVDGTRDAAADVPAEFRAVQWTQLPSGETSAAFCERVKALLDGEGVARAFQPVGTEQSNVAHGLKVHATPVTRGGRTSRIISAVAAAVAITALAIWQPWKNPARSEAKQSTPASPTSSSDAKSVAVLPFANHSGDREQDYFSDGLTEEILNALRRERDLSVPGNTSCFSFKGKSASAAEIAKALNVTRLVEGSVRKDGSRVRISVTLTRAADGFSEELGTFTEELADIFALQEKVARAVVTKLTRRTTTSAMVAPTKSPEAYDAYLRGRALQTRSSSHRSEVARLYEKAVAHDPSFALAWAALAEVRYIPYARYRDRSPEVASATRDAIDRALAARPNLPEALIARANWERHVKGDYAAAQRDLALAESQQGPSAELRNIQAYVARDLGNWGEAFRFSREMVQLDPQNADYLSGHGSTLCFPGGDYAAADRLLAQAIAIQGPDAGAAFSTRGGLRLVWRGPEAALRLMERAPPALAVSPRRRVELLIVLGRLDEARVATDATERDVAMNEIVVDMGIRRGVGLSHLMAIGREEQARRRAQEIIADSLKEFARGNRSSVVRREHIRAEIALGRREAALGALEEWRREAQLMPNRFQRTQELGENAASLYALLGKPDEAIALLREFAPAGRQFYASLRHEIDFAPIRNDPRFQELIKQQEAWARAQPDPIDP